MFGDRRLAARGAGEHRVAEVGIPQGCVQKRPVPLHDRPPLKRHEGRIERFHAPDEFRLRQWVHLGADDRVELLTGHRPDRDRPGQREPPLLAMSTAAWAVSGMASFDRRFHQATAFARA